MTYLDILGKSVSECSPEQCLDFVSISGYR